MAVSTENAMSGKKGNPCMQWLVAMLAKNKFESDAQCLSGNNGTVSFVANTTLLTYGFQAGWVSPMTKVLQSEDSPAGYPLSDYEISWIASSLCIAATFGVSLFAYIVDRYGRKVAILIMAALQALCWIMKLSSAHIAVLIIARLCTGLSAGGCYNVVPMYVREISQDDIRGVLGSFIILFQNIGILAMFAMGAYLNYYTVLWIVIRAKVMGGLVTYAWFMSFLQLACFTAVANFLGTYTVVYCYAGINLCGALVGLILLPETKGKTVEQIEMDILGKNKQVE
ncbi:hypothetical protein HF086_017637 [Spodoptera exigua]|uniref:Major facilitator superfamily (MFS) profile domain-containing protein n=1 Tax=Spodoptera exigua TaxID=7107 RepID=A0A922SFV2_SPOEX|nr:hypothetical protein HF086_017637 [Spodoptera exigua]